MDGKVISWENARKLLSKEILCSEFFIELDKLVPSLKKSKKDYVYLVDIEYGEKIIEKGKTRLSEIKIDNSNYLNSNLNQDFSYSNDPLGVVIEGCFEVVTKNQSNDREHGSIKKKYAVLLNRINQGDYFGVFGTVDFLNSIDNKELVDDWHVYSGEVTYEFCFPINLCMERLTRVDDKIRAFYDPTYQQLDIDGKIYLTRKIFADTQIPSTKAILFPAHIVTLVKNSDLELFLNRTAWAQSNYLRNYHLESKYFYDRTLEIAYSRISDTSIESLAYIAQYLSGVSKGLNYALVPAKGSFYDILIDQLITYDKEQTKGTLPYLETANHFYPFLFRYENIQPHGKALVSVATIPIMYSYNYRRFNLLCQDLIRLIEELNIHIELHGVNNKGKNGMKKHIELKKEYFIPAFSLDKKYNIQHINMASSREFFNVFYIQRK